MQRFLVGLLIVVALAARAFAQSYSDDFTKLREQQQKSIQAAVEPINRRYVEALEQLLHKATQAGDLTTALAVREELGRYGQTPAGGPTNLAPASAAVATGIPPILPILYGKWKSHNEDGADDLLVFRPDGTVSQEVHKKQGHWRVQGDVLIITIGKESQRYPMPLDAKTNKGKTDTNKGIRITKVE
jgi:hypothetical protein